MLRNYDYLLKKKVTRTYAYKVASGFHLLQNMLLATSTFSKEEIICPKPFNKAVQKYLKSVLVHEYRKYMVKYKKNLLFLFFASRFEKREKENKRSEPNTENDLFEILLSEEYVLDKLDFYLLAARFRIPLKVTGLQPNLFLERWKEAEQKKKIQEKKEELEEKKELEELEKEEELEEKKEEIEEIEEKEEKEELKEKEENKEISFFWKDASYFYFELDICDDDAKLKKKEYKLTVVDKLFSDPDFSFSSSSSFIKEKKKEYKNKIPNIKKFFSSFLIIPNKTEKKKFKTLFCF